MQIDLLLYRYLVQLHWENTSFLEQNQTVKSVSNTVVVLLIYFYSGSYTK